MFSGQKITGKTSILHIFSQRTTASIRLQMSLDTVNGHIMYMLEEEKYGESMFLGSLKAGISHFSFVTNNLKIEAKMHFSEPKRNFKKAAISS